MAKKIKFLIILLIIPILSSCSGTGSKIKPSITSSNNGNTGLYLTREGGFLGGGVLAKIEVNGREIGKLETKESITHNVSSNFKIKVSGAGIGGITMGHDTIAGTNDEQNHFYIVSVKQGFFSAGFKINETTEVGFNQSN